MSVTIQLKRSGSKNWGWATGPLPELFNLARQVHAEVKHATLAARNRDAPRHAHIDLTINQVEQAIKKGAQIE
jgi:hypothetical protein